MTPQLRSGIRQRQEIFLGSRAPRRVISPLDPSFVHHEDPIAHAQHFRQFAADHDDGLAFGGQPVHQQVDFVFRADVDARVSARRK